MPASQTVNTTDGQHTFKATIKDSTGTAIPNETGDSYTWTVIDPQGVVALPLQPNVDQCTVKHSGQAGTATVNVSAAKAGAATVTGTMQLVVQGPVRDHVDISMVA